MTSTKDDILKMVATQAGVQADQVKPETSFVDLHMDSLDHAELVLCFEEEFECNVPDSEAQAFKTPADLIAYVEKNNLDGSPTVGFAGGMGIP